MEKHYLRRLFLMVKLLIFFIFLFSFQSCHQKAPNRYSANKSKDMPLTEKVKFYGVDELDFSIFKNSKFSNYYNKTYDAELFLDNFYQPWNYQKETDAKKAQQIWEEHFTYEKGIAAVREKSSGEILEAGGSPCYTGNFREYSAKYLQELKQNLPTKKAGFLEIKKYGITTETSHIRGLPTDEFCFKSVRNCGEGYPFDYLQYTSLWVGTPIAILDQSNDGLWYFVESPYSMGWVKTKSIALVDQQQIDQITASEKVVVMGDNILLKGANSNQKVFAGTLLPFDATTQKIGFPTKSSDNKLVFENIPLKSNYIKPFPVAFNQNNVKTLLSQMLEMKYSWGGIDGGRDCSSLLKDYFTPFGIWLPRNSKAQSLSGEMVDLVEKNTAEKRETISTQGIPFLSTLYLPGHITLYLGNEELGQLKMYHTTWGLKTFFSEPDLHKVMKSRDRYGIYGLTPRNDNRVETRSVIGKTVITDIELEQPLREIPNLWVKPYLQIMETMTNPAIKNQL